MLTQDGNGLKLIYRRSRAEGGSPKRDVVIRDAGSVASVRLIPKQELGVDRSRRARPARGEASHATKYLLGVGGDALASPSGR